MLLLHDVAGFTPTQISELVVALQDKVCTDRSYIHRRIQFARKYAEKDAQRLGLRDRRTDTG
jgi:hypothetical protein